MLHGVILYNWKQDPTKYQLLHLWPNLLVCITISTQVNTY